MHVSRVIKTGIAFIIIASVGLASTNSCPNATASSNVNNGTTTNLMTIPGAGSGNDLSTLGAGGCIAVDFAFANFGGSFTGAGANGAATLGGTYLAETPAGTLSDPITNPDTLLFASVRGTTAGTDGSANDSNNNFVENGTAAITDQFAVHVGASGTNPGNTISSVTLAVLQAAISGSSTGSIIVDVCSGSQTGVITSAGSCTGSFFSQTLTLATLATQNISVALPNLSNFNITTVVNLTGQNVGNQAGFDAFSLAFNETAPEPSSFIVGATGLAGLFLLKLRRRRGC